MDAQSLVRSGLEIDPAKITKGFAGNTFRKGVISIHFHSFPIWGWVKTLVPSEPQNSWDL